MTKFHYSISENTARTVANNDEQDMMPVLPQTNWPDKSVFELRAKIFLYN